MNIYYNEYFNGKENILVRIGSDKDKQNRRVVENTNIYRNIPEADIQRTCELLGITDKKFKGRKVDIGTYNQILLTKDMRLFTGNTVSHSFLNGTPEAARVLKSVQRWYGEYKLPDKLYVTEMTESEMAEHPEFQDVVNGASNRSVLGYWHADAGLNMWEAEGFDYEQQDHYAKQLMLSNGDVIFYHAGKKSSDDYKVGGNR